MVKRHKLIDGIRSKCELKVNGLRTEDGNSHNVICFMAQLLPNGDFARDKNGNAIPGELVTAIQPMSTEIEPSLMYGNNSWVSRSRGGIRHKENCQRGKNGK